MSVGCYNAVVQCLVPMNITHARGLVGRLSGRIPRGAHSGVLCSSDDAVQSLIAPNNSRSLAG